MYCKRLFAALFFSLSSPYSLQATHQISPDQNIEHPSKTKEKTFFERVKESSADFIAPILILTQSCVLFACLDYQGKLRNRLIFWKNQSNIWQNQVDFWQTQSNLWQKQALK